MRVICPECNQALTLKAPLPAGKRLKRPKCATVFVPDEAPADEPEENAVSDRPMPKRRPRPRGDDEDELDHDRNRDDDFDDRPAPKKKAKGKKKKSSLLLSGLLGGAGALAVVVIIVVQLILISGRSGAVKQHEEAAKEMVQALTDLEATMASVKDPKTAQVAAAQIDQIRVRMEQLTETSKKLPKITAADDREIQQKYKPQFDAIAQRMQNVGFQAGLNSQGEPDFLAAAKRLEQVGRKMQKLGN